MIRVLDQNTIDKIAAGEVIEKPSSVVKELVENSIDSGATAVTVEIKDGGLSFIRITDNGCGIGKEDVPKAFLRHATSKLISAEDLLSLSSLGFRGEALSSIAAVAQVEMMTKQEDCLTGVRYQIHGGTEISLEEIGCPTGTTTIVRNLFYNTPARKKFMKTAATEFSYIYDLICRISMSHPEISFKLIANGSNKLFTSGNGKLKDIIYHIYGKDITNNLIEVNAENEYLKISGYIAKPSVSRGNRSFEDYYVNHRYVKSKIITKAIEDAFRTFVMIHKFPFTVLNFEIHPDLIDVNIHPTKMELKFMNGQAVYDFTYQTIREHLLFKELILETTLDKERKPVSPSKRDIGKKPEPFETRRRENMLPEQKNVQQPAQPEQAKPAQQQMQPPEQPRMHVLSALKEETSAYQIPEIAAQTKLVTAINQEHELKDESAVQKNEPAFQKNETVKQESEQPAVRKYEAALQKDEAVLADTKQKYTQIDLFEERFLTEEARMKHRLIGQLFKTYWLIEYDNKLFIMDQHAAHEKVKFEELMANYKNKKVISQYLMPPAVVTLTAAEISFLQENLELFEALGYSLSAFGGKEYKLNAVPANLFGLDGRELFIDFIGELVEDSKKATIDIFISKLSTMACKAAIKGNTAISFEEADALIDQLLKLENPYTCPHGRPTLISMTEQEIEKKFKRIV